MDMASFDGRIWKPLPCATGANGDVTSLETCATGGWVVGSTRVFEVTL